jgi:hypothetical protein
MPIVNIGVDDGNVRRKLITKKHKLDTPVGLSLVRREGGRGDLEVAQAAGDVITWRNGSQWTPEPSASASTEMARFTHWPEAMKISFLYSLSRVPTETKSKRFRVMIGAPLDALNDAEAVRKAAREELCGLYTFEVNGEPQSIEIADAYIASQPKAALVTTPGFKNKRVFLADWGFVTGHSVGYDEARKQDGQSAFIDAVTGWRRVGAYRAADELSNYLNGVYTNYGLSKIVNIHEADQIILGARRLEVPNGAMTEATEFVKVLKAQNFNAGVEFFNAQMAHMVPEIIRFVGGTTVRYEQQIRARWKSLVSIPEDPIFSVAQGLLVLANSYWRD